MKRYIYSVRDNVAEVFQHTINEVNDGTAIRAFTSSFADNPNKNDFSLFCIGAWNDSTGVIDSMEPMRIYSGYDIKTNNVVDLPNSLKEQAE